MQFRWLRLALPLLLLAASGVSTASPICQAELPPLAGEPPPIAAPLGAEELEPLLTAATRLSRLPPLPAARVPPVCLVTEAQLRAIVCEHQAAGCRGLQATYDTERNRVLVADWGRDRGSEWESFVVHELVHALQYAQRGAAIYAGCETTRATELQAYAVQDAYLKERGALMRVGAVMNWWWVCPDGPSTPRGAL